jgi:hypothetical protein
MADGKLVGRVSISFAETLVASRKARLIASEEDTALWLARRLQA